MSRIFGAAISAICVLFACELNAQQPSSAPQPASPPQAGAAPPAAATPVPPAAGTPAAPPPKPGGMQVMTPNPDRAKWDIAVNNDRSMRVYTCKPLACADAVRVTMTFGKSPTANPDPAALEKYAKVDYPKTLRARSASLEIMTDSSNKTDTLASKTSQVKGYPAVLNETKFTRDKKVTFLNTTIIFAGPAMVTISSVSPLRDLAQKSLDEFIGVMQFVAGPPAQPGAPAPGKPKIDNNQI